MRKQPLDTKDTGVQQKRLPFLLRHRKTVIAVACIGMIGTAMYVDYRAGIYQSDSYLYTSSVGTDESSSDYDVSKILGEAKFVDSRSDLSDVQNTSSDTANYFADAQMERRRARDESVEMLQTVVQNAEALPDAKAEALNQMMGIAADIATESSIEALICAKGFEDCIAVIRDDTVNVIVKTSGLLTNEVAQITEIVMNETGFSADNIRLTEKIGK